MSEVGGGSGGSQVVLLLPLSGDVTPATSNGQTFFCFFVFFTIVLVAKLLGELVAFFEEKMEDRRMIKTSNMLVFTTIYPLSCVLILNPSFGLFSSQKACESTP